MQDTYTEKRQQWLRERNTCGDVLTIVTGAVFVLLALDVLGAVLWMASGQVPQDSVFAGAITRSVINFII